MFTSGTSPLTPLRAGLWHFLLVAGLAWLAIGWSMLRLEPLDAVRAAGPVVLFGAVSEMLRALAGSNRWGLHTALAVLFTATGAVLLVDDDASLATPAALIGWYLLVRGAADIALSAAVRGVDRSWGVIMTLGVAQAGLGFYAASSYARSATVVVLLLAALAVARGIADLVTAMDLRDSPAGRIARDRAAGVAGYAAGLADYAAAATGRAGRPRHRARGMLAGRPAEDAMESIEQAADLNAVLALAGVGDSTVDSHRIAHQEPVTPFRPATIGDGGTGGMTFSVEDASSPATPFTDSQHFTAMPPFDPAQESHDPHFQDPQSLEVQPLEPVGVDPMSGGYRVPAGPPIPMSIRVDGLDPADGGYSDAYDTGHAEADSGPYVRRPGGRRRP